MKRTIITLVLALCVISTVCCAYAAAVETAKTEVVLNIEETTTQFTSQAQANNTTESNKTFLPEDNSTIKTGSIVSLTTIAAVFLMLTATVVFFWFYKKKKLSIKE